MCKKCAYDLCCGRIRSACAFSKQASSKHSLMTVCATSFCENGNTMDWDYKLNSPYHIGIRSIVNIMSRLLRSLPHSREGCWKNYERFKSAWICCFFVSIFFKSSVVYFFQRQALSVHEYRNLIPHISVKQFTCDNSLLLLLLMLFIALLA